VRLTWFPPAFAYHRRLHPTEPDAKKAGGRLVMPGTPAARTLRLFQSRVGAPPSPTARKIRTISCNNLRPNSA
jgi:hypothetical protein